MAQVEACADKLDGLIEALETLDVNRVWRSRCQARKHIEEESKALAARLDCAAWPIVRKLMDERHPWPPNAATHRIEKRCLLEPSPCCGQILDWSAR